MDKDPIVIVSIARTPQGNMLGELKHFTAPQLGAAVIKSAMLRANLTPNDINEVIMGCVLPAGVGQAPARQAALLAGLSNATECTTINKVCGSGMKAVIFACNALHTSNPTNVMIAGGMESMSNAPYMIPKARQGYRLGNAVLLDHMTFDGLEDAYDKGRPMGYFAEQCAKKYGFSREEQDLYARGSLERAQKAIREKLFESEITPLALKTNHLEQLIDTDEHPGAVDIEKITRLPPIFMENGTITAANSSSIADGSAALVLMRRSHASNLGLTPLATIIGFAGHAKEPSEFATAPIDAIQTLLEKIHWTIKQVDLFEINEAFAVVALAAMQNLEIPREKLNIHGGGCALGHPIGATGARIIVTLVAALRHYGLKRGVAALCIGGGEATAIAVEVSE